MKRFMVRRFTEIGPITLLKTPIKLMSPLFLAGLITFSYSQNYQMRMLTVNKGGGTATSFHYKVNSAIGLPLNGKSTSANYQMHWGLFSPHYMNLLLNARTQMTETQFFIDPDPFTWRNISGYVLPGSGFFGYTPDGWTITTKGGATLTISTSSTYNWANFYTPSNVTSSVQIQTGPLDISNLGRRDLMMVSIWMRTSPTLAGTFSVILHGAADTTSGQFSYQFQGAAIESDSTNSMLIYPDFRRFDFAFIPPGSDYYKISSFEIKYAVVKEMATQETTIQINKIQLYTHRSH